MADITLNTKTSSPGEWLVPVTTVATVFVMLVPVPAIVLDLLLAMSMTLGVIVLLSALYILKPVQFSVFPTLLLFLTLCRISLNIASSRRILLHGTEGSAAAGSVIQAFGQFVVGGNYVVGFVIFRALSAIQSLVINHGAVRTAEVAARFTLDAMPGKQMAVDAELNAGLINELEARQRRRKVGEEADLYGAMDGASKFVRGDAIAAVLITLINIIGGFAIGIAQKGLSITEALQHYPILSIGDGLVSQVPALITSTAAGILITRATAKNDLGRELGRQLLFYPRALTVLAGMLTVMGLVPGLPTVPFLVLAAIFGLLSYTMHRHGALELTPAGATLNAPGPPAKNAE